MNILIRLRIAVLYLFLIVIGTTVTVANESFGKHEVKCDSLKLVLKKQNLSARHELKVRWELVVTYASYAVDSVIAYAPEAIALAQKFKEYEIEFDCRCHLGAAYCFKGNYETAIREFEQLRMLAGKQKNGKLFEANAMRLIAFAHALQGKYNTAVDYYLKALLLYEEEGNIDGCLVIYSNLGEIYRRLNNREIAIRYLDQATRLCEKNMLTNDVWRMSNIYNEYAANYLSDNLLPKAMEYALKADSINTGVAIINKCHTKILLAKIHLRLNEHDKALIYARNAMEQAEILKDNDLRMNVWRLFSDIYLIQQRYSEAEAAALEVLQIDSTNIDLSRTAAANIALANIYLNDTEKAAHYFRKQEELNDLYSKTNFQNTMSDMIAKYETEKKEARIVVLEQKHFLYLLIGIISFLLTGSLGVVLWQKTKNARREKQLIATRSVMDGEMGERTRLARDLHDRLSGSLSALKIGLNDKKESFQQINDKLDTCIEEIRRVAHNLMPASLQFGLKVALGDFVAQCPNVLFHFFGEERHIEERKAFVIYCCAVELVNNSLRHSGAKQINVQLIQSEKHVSLTVQDNGCGFDEKSVAKGIGLKNIYTRVASCNGKIDIVTSFDKGTEITIELKTEEI